ncbi:MAG: efflux RND transporter periplasmic adaptor subunit [Planctomycetes bacterium]|nr:efflux RND transporter periplasmic adaptor subunit [Planctomycetota bacterium]
MDGRIGRYYLTQGNLANQDKTQLATVVSLDPIHVHLDIDEATFMRLRKLADGPKGAKAMEIQIGLAGDDGYPHRAVVDFVDNRVNPATATIRVRAVLPNAKGLMLPGMFVRARLPIGEPAEALLVTDRVVQRKKAGAWLYVVNADNKVEVRYVKLGALQSDGLRVIASGLKKDDLVLVTGLNSVEPFMRIQPMRVAMPTLGGDEPKKEKKKPASEEASDVKAATWWISAKLKTARAKTIANAMSLAQARHRGILFRADSRHAVNPSADASPLKSKAAER